MKLGMIIDIDHMSNNSAEQTLAIAEAIPGGGYPLVSGHTGIRELMIEHRDAENSRTRAQLQRIGCLQGMFGVGTSEVDAYEWARTYGQAYMEMTKPFKQNSPCPNRASWFGPGSVAFGTDANSLVKSPRPTSGSDKLPGAPIRVGLYSLPGFPQSVAPKYYPPNGIGVGTYWDYNRDGVAHYGMFADFVKDVRYAPGTPQMNMTGKDLVDNHLMRSADYFWRMWQKIEVQRTKVP
jgi:hypothetical protein